MYINNCICLLIIILYINIALYYCMYCNKVYQCKTKGFIDICPSSSRKEPQDEQLCKTVNNNKNSNNYCMHLLDK